MLETALWSQENIFPCDASGASKARDFVCQQLVEHDLLYLVEDIRLVASELATNAMLHARTPFTVSLQQVGRVVLLTVQDSSSSLPEKADTHVLDTHGRGLVILDAVSHDWGVTVGPRGSKSVWASFVTRSG